MGVERGGSSSQRLSGEPGPVTVAVDADDRGRPSRPGLADGRVRAAVPAALRRRRPRQRHRGRVRGGAAGWRMTTSASPTCAPTRSCTTTTTVVTRADDGTLLFDFSRGRPALRPDPRDGPQARRRAVLHAGRARPRSAADRLQLPRHHLAASQVGRVARARRRARRSTWSTATASTRSPPGPSRSGTSRTSRSSGPAPRTTTCACTTRRPTRSRSVDSRLLGRRTLDRRGGVDRAARGPRREAERPLRLRHVPHVRQPASRRAALRSRGTGTATSRSGGPNGASGRRTSARSTTESAAPPSCSAGTRPCRAGWTRWPTG